ncbi:hypothetical protein [Haliangium sp.]|uniref:hypothetical protein n=1 Tax=Haliangium sp. TaxID=2663208 RepID=UPI003D0A06F1
MASTPTPSKPSPIRTRTERSRSVQILAKTLVRDLTAQGYGTCDIVNLATQLLDQVTSHVDKRTSGPGRPD